MSSDKEIGAPFTLASLSKSVGSTNGRIHATGVCSISGIKKRKRTEIVVGVEGECISIYSLQNPQLVTSYALPPSASFTAAPYSTYRKGSSKTPAQRFTYASVTESTAGAKSQLVCFHETILGDNAETAKTLYTPSNGSHVSTIESLPVAGGSSTHDVLATFENGDVVCLSADLSAVRWTANLRAAGSQKDSAFSIENVTLSTARNVSRGLLRNREDIAALLNPDATEAADLLELTQILCAIGQTTNGTRILQLLQVQPRNSDLPSAQLQPLKHLLSISLPKPSSILLRTDSTATYSLHATSGSLHILLDGGVISYDLSGTVPRINSELLLNEAKIDSFVRISQDIVFATAPGSCRAFDVKYNSLQAYLSLETTSSSDDAASKKRKHAQPDTETAATPQLVAYYAELGLVVAVREDELLGMQYAGTNARKRVKTEGTLLIDALGKGVAKPKAGAESAKWLDRKEKLDRYASKSKIAKFEGVLASCLGIPLEKRTETEIKQDNEVQGGPLTNGVGPSIPKEDAMAIDKAADEDAGEDQLRKWNIPAAIPESQRQLHRQHALYALSKIFRFEGNTLKVAFFPPNVFQWLLQIGHLTKESIRRALLDEATESAHMVPKINDGDIAKAIVAFDPELHLLSAVLNHKHFLPIGEVVEAVRLLTQSLDDKPATAEDTPKLLLTNGAAPTETDMDVDAELDTATTEVDHALTVLDDGVSIRSNTLRPALTRLHTFPAPLISATLRAILPRRDLESLIRLLHSELKNGGWSSQYDFVDPEATTDDSPDDHAVTIIASLLSSVLDAIGAGAWLAAVGTPSAADDAGKDIIDSLHADCSEALNGFWEARYMRGLLGEFLRYAANLPKSAKPSSKALENQGKPFALEVQKDGEDLPMLPLGGRGDMGVEKTKQGKGGRKEERSKREIGMLISKKVPKYSFERVVV
ncbi:hypothetical protein G6514_002234 [Epicoccum nigrum]|nr:hypothetical protein G6514_002234 [Epicoccum nigrum]